jgi:hypothetical protein
MVEPPDYLSHTDAFKQSSSDTLDSSTLKKTASLIYCFTSKKFCQNHLRERLAFARPPAHAGGSDF